MWPPAPHYLLRHAGEVLGLDGGGFFVEGDEGVVASVVWGKWAAVAEAGVGDDGA